MRRREFITLLGGAAAAWPLAARAQQGERMRRIGVLMYTTPDEPESQARIARIRSRATGGGLDGRPQRADRRPLERRRSDAPAQGRRGPGRAGSGRVSWPVPARPRRRCSRRAALCQSCSPNVVDPVGAGLVRSLSRPGGNITGFTQFEYGLSAQMAGAAQGDRAANCRAWALCGTPIGAVGIGQWAVIQVAASLLGVELSPLDLDVASDTEARCVRIRERTRRRPDRGSRHRYHDPA